MSTWGTSYFVSRDAAFRYYKAYGLSKANVERKLKDGEIHIGVPHTRTGEKLTRIDGGKRYAITDAPKSNPAFYEVLVGNIGKVWQGSNYMQAMAKYAAYVKQSKSGTGRAGGEQVSLWKDGEPIREHDETEPGYTSNPERGAPTKGRKNPTKRYPTKKKPGDPTYSAQWSGVTGAPKIKGKVCARCGGKVHREAGSAYCPYCDDYVQTVASNPSGALSLKSAGKLARFKSNPGRLTDVLVKRGGRVFKAKAKYDGKLGRVRIFANPTVAHKINPESGKPKLTPEQKKALAAYNFALQQEDRYLGSVFVTPTGQRRVEAVTKEAYDRCKRLGMDHRHGL